MDSLAVISAQEELEGRFIILVEYPQTTFMCSITAKKPYQGAVIEIRYDYGVTDFSCLIWR